jgi:hypothetical protein
VSKLAPNHEIMMYKIMLEMGVAKIACKIAVEGEYQV